MRQTKTTLWNEANLTTEYKICDNVDLDTIYLDFCSYYHMKFGKLPKILRKIENDLNEPINQRAKVIKVKNTDGTTKDDCQKKAKKECFELNANGIVITNAVSNGEDFQRDKKPWELISNYRKNVDLFEQFVGESRELAYIIERSVKIMVIFLTQINTL